MWHKATIQDGLDSGAVEVTDDDLSDMQNPPTFSGGFWVVGDGLVAGVDDGSETATTGSWGKRQRQHPGQPGHQPHPAGGALSLGGQWRLAGHSDICEQRPSVCPDPLLFPSTAVIFRSESSRGLRMLQVNSSEFLGKICVHCVFSIKLLKTLTVLN